MRILVTGGAGYIASHTNLELLQAGHEVIVLDNLCNSSEEAVHRVEKLTGKQIDFYKQDLRDEKALEEIFAKEDIDAVIHFAGLKAVGESCEVPLQYFENNLVATIVLLRVMEKYQVKNLVFSSSATVYGIPERLPITEEDKLSVLNPYGRTKLVIEDMLRDIYKADAGWNIAILRYFNPIGAHESGKIGEDAGETPCNLFPLMAKVAMGQAECIHIYGDDYETKDGTGVRDYIHVMDLAEGHLYALEKLQESPGLVTYNLGTGIGYSVFEIMHHFEKVCGKKLPYRIEKRRKGDVAACYADASKAKKELGWAARRDMQKMCEDSWRWYTKNPRGYRT